MQISVLFTAAGDINAIKEFLQYAQNFNAVDNDT